jgi:hypothetical protein
MASFVWMGSPMTESLSVQPIETTVREGSELRLSKLLETW